jgi:hypothetical protein
MGEVGFVAQVAGVAVAVWRREFGKFPKMFCSSSPPIHKAIRTNNLNQLKFYLTGHCVDLNQTDAVSNMFFFALLHSEFYRMVLLQSTWLVSFVIMILPSIC